MILALGGLIGFIAIAFGAYAEHGLRDIVTNEHFRFLMTAIRYNQVHAVVIVALGLTMMANRELARQKLLKWASYLFILGTSIFSFSIYVSVWLELPKLVNVTPIGGVTLMVAWLALALAGYRAWRR